MATRETNDGRARTLPAGKRVAVAVSDYHADLTGAMLASASAVLADAGLEPDALQVVRVPGAFELPLAARRLARHSDCVLCFGLVLKGETSHDEYIARAAAQAVMDVSLDLDKPVLFGILTCDTLEQARDRALPVDQGGKHDKGAEVARAAVDMLNALEQIEEGAPGRRALGFGSPAGGVS